MNKIDWLIDKLENDFYYSDDIDSDSGSFINRLTTYKLLRLREYIDKMEDDERMIMNTAKINKFTFTNKPISFIYFKRDLINLYFKIQKDNDK